jgi:hypothetical protein
VQTFRGLPREATRYLYKLIRIPAKTGQKSLETAHYFRSAAF